MAIQTGDPLRNLRPDQRDAVADALDLLTDQFVEDLASLEQGGLEFDETHMAMYLPSRFGHRYDFLFAKRFLLAFATVGWKLAQREHYRLSCVAEEMAARAIIEAAETMLETREEKADFGPLYEWFEDLDFERLYERQDDGIEDSETARGLGMANLRFEDWFKPFTDDHPDVNPYLSRRGMPLPS